MDFKFNITQDSLNIYKEIIANNESIAEHWVELSLRSSSDQNIYYLSQAINIANKFHSYFHFEQSYVYTIAAKIYQSLSDDRKTIFYFEKAIFQDHNNQEALKEISKFPGANNKYSSFYRPFQNNGESYNNHIKYERQFLEFAITDFYFDEKLTALDNAIKELENGNLVLTKDIIKEYTLYFSTKDFHRFFILEALIYYHEGKMGESINSIERAIHILESRHQIYHNQSARLYLLRAKYFDNIGESILSQNDKLKSHDLDQFSHL